MKGNTKGFSREDLLEKVQEEFEANIPLVRKVLEKDLYKFNKYVMEIEKGKDKLPLAQVHKEMCTFIDSNKKKKKLTLIPRGHLKSTVITVGRSLQAICADQSVRILIANATYSLSCSFLTEIKRNLKYNEKIKMIWGDLAVNAEKWSENQISLDKGGGVTGKKEPTVTAMGVESSLTSQHYDIIIMDDVVNEAFVNTKEQIEKTIDFYKECLNLLEPGGEMIIVGTRWDDKDLYGWILDKENNVLEDFEVFIKVAYEGDLEVKEGFKALYPEKYSRKHLLSLYKQQGPYRFSCQMMNNPIPKDDATFRQDWFKYYEPEDIRGKPMNKFTCVDPAISLATEADFTAIVTVGVDEFGMIYVLEVKKLKLKPSDLINEIFKTYQMFRPIKLGIEDVAFQKTLQYTMYEEMKNRGIYMPLEPIKPQARTKDERIRGLQPLYANGRVLHYKHTPNISDLEEQLLRFPRAKHDDLIDALSYNLDLMFAPRAKKASRQTRRKYLY